MICNVCGEVQPCAHRSGSRVTAPSKEHRDISVRDARHTGTADSRILESIPLDDLVSQVRARSDQRNWRQEVALRVNRHRARRHRADDETSLELDFPEDQALAVNSGSFIRPRTGATGVIAQPASGATEESLQVESSSRDEVGRLAMQRDIALDQAFARRAHKIIRFPKYSAEIARSAAPLITEIELAEPVVETPRIMEARSAEQMDLLPSFTEIRLEESAHDSKLRTHFELPLCPASLGQRLFSGLLDMGIVSLAIAIFAFSLAKIAPTPVYLRTQLSSCLAIAVVLWLLFQYLFLVYGRATPGMRAAHLQLRSFDGENPSLFARRSRALASVLSAISVGLGFVWALVDEDTLGWHDRISQTYLKSKNSSWQIAIRKKAKR